MQCSFTKVLILRPQAKLLLLINSQLPDFNWSLATTKSQDLTAYVLSDFKNDIDMLSNLECNFVKIFQNELKKIIGSQNSKKLNFTFLDFLSCFKFEWHVEAKIVYQKFAKRVCLAHKHVVMSVNLKKIKTVEDLCRIADRVDFIENSTVDTILFVDSMRKSSCTHVHSGSALRVFEQLEPTANCQRSLLNTNAQIIPIKNLTSRHFWRESIVKFRCVISSAARQVKYSCNWHWFSHARDPGF